MPTTEESRSVWDAVAPGWERHRDEVFEAQRHISERLVEAIGAQPGDSVLELTAGPGETGFLLAECAPGTHVIVSDFAPRMVQAARTAATARALTNVEVRQIDAQAIDLPDDSVAGVMSRYGMMLVPETATAFAEIRRVLAPGGRLAYAVWGPLAANPWMMVFGAAFMQRGLFTPPEEGIFSLTTEEENRAALEAAGFRDITIDIVDSTVTFEDVEQFWEVNSSVAGPLAIIAQAQPEEEKAQLRALLEQFTASFRTPDGLAMPSQTIVARAS